MPKKRRKVARGSRPQLFKVVIYASILFAVLFLLQQNLSNSQGSDVLGIRSFLAAKPAENPTSRRDPEKKEESQAVSVSQNTQRDGRPEQSERKLPPPKQPQQDSGEIKRGSKFIPSDSVIKVEVDSENSEIASDGGILKRHLGARIHFPHTIDPTTNTMYITTPAGTKSVVLPQVAIQNMLTKGILSKIGGHIATSSGGLGDGEDDATDSGVIVGTESVDGDVIVEAPESEIELVEEAGLASYKIKGSVKKRFLGLVPVDLSRTVTVSADSGELTKIDQSLLTGILAFFSL